MGNNRFSRRQFLQMASGLGIVPLVGKLQKFFPEADTAFANNDEKIRAILQIPNDLEMKIIEGKQAEMMISQALAYKDAKKLQKSLKSFAPVVDEAHVTEMSWENGMQNVTVISIPFMNPEGDTAVLQCVIKDEVAEINMAEFLNQDDLSKAKIHTVKNGKIAGFDADLATTSVGRQLVTESSTCTAQILIQCLGLWGCSGLALTTCATALLLCPFTIWSCIAVYTCTLYCGGAWSQCYCWACGC